MTITEALWKETPVIAGNVGGIKLQIENGFNGYLVNSVEETAEKVLHLLKNPKLAEQMGERGREKVKNEFLLNKHVENYLDLFSLLNM
jgi:trehalose synthase